MTRPLFLATLLIATAAGPVGRWQGTFETSHGPSALEVAIDSTRSGYGGLFRMEFMGQPVTGALDSLRIRGDSLAFVVGFLTSGGPGRFSFRGTVAGNRTSGRFVGFLGDTPMSDGAWALEREP